MNTRRAAVLIDGAYWGHVREAFGRPPVDLVALSDTMCEPIDRLRTYYYDALAWVSDPPTSHESVLFGRKRSFFAMLDRLERFEVRTGTVQRVEETCENGPPHVRYNQKLVDVKLSVELVRLAWSGQIERAVLVTGDSDFVPAVEAGVIVRLLYAREGRAWAHDELVQAVDERVKMDRSFVERFPLDPA